MTDFDAHEALDRAYLVGEMFDTSLTEHRFILQNPEHRSRCEQIAAALGDLYQAIGAVAAP